MFTNQPNMVTNSFPVNSSKLSPESFRKNKSLNVFYPPRYTWRTRDCDSANHEVINIDMDNFDREKAFSVANVHTQVKLFNETLTSIYL